MVADLRPAVLAEIVIGECCPEHSHLRFLVAGVGEALEGVALVLGNLQLPVDRVPDTLPERHLRGVVELTEKRDLPLVPLMVVGRADVDDGEAVEAL